MNQETKNCQNCKTDFVIEPEDFTWYEKFKVPPPTWCPECRFKRRAMFRNDRKLFRVKDGLTGAQILSLYPPESGYTIYNDIEWRDPDLWDAATYGRDFDPSRPFLAQLFELDRSVPKYSRSYLELVNSDYCANASWLRNCYLMFNSNKDEDCAYGNGVDMSRDCYDNSHIQRSERCYECFWLTKCYDTHFSSQCEDCTSLWFSKNCRGCTDCFGCVNLRNKTHCFLNEQLTKEEYDRRLKELRLDTAEGLRAAKEQTRAFWLRFPVKSLQGVQNTNVSGEYVTHSKNVKRGYLIRECENLSYVQYSQIPSSRDCMDVTLTGNAAESIYESAVCGWNGMNFKFCVECWDGCHDLEYCLFCGTGSADLFGCVGIKNRQYCILNKQYSKEDYLALRERIVAHMDAMPYVDEQGRVYRYGEFFPPSFSPFAFNQTIAIEHFPISKEEVAAFGVRWQEPNPTEYQTTMLSSAVPEAITDVKDDILKEIIQCADCKRAYRLIAPELQFLRRSGIPAPRTCVDCRHNARIAQRNRSHLYPRACNCGGKASSNGLYLNTVVHAHGDGACPERLEVSYAPDRPDIVYCEACYNAEVA